ncbi:MAG TPA: hypothetical protein VII92_11115 [Anaerolineae bacterium]
MNLLHTLLTLYTWGIFCGLIIVLQRVARFYQITSGQRSHYQWFLLPLLLLLAGALRYAMLPNFVGDGWGDLFLLTGGISLIILSYFLLHLMTGGRS